MAHVLPVRLGTLGIQPQTNHAPRVTLSCCATIPATNAQYPQPLVARMMEITVFTTLPATSLAEVALNRMRRLRRAMCITDAEEMNIPAERPLATCVTGGK